MSRICAGCSSPVSNAARFCRSCGRAQPPPSPAPGSHAEAADAPTVFSSEPREGVEQAAEPSAEQSPEPAGPSEGRSVEQSGAPPDQPAQQSEPSADQSEASPEVESPAAAVSCAICGAAAVGGGAICGPCAELMNPERNAR